MDEGPTAPDAVLLVLVPEAGGGVQNPELRKLLKRLLRAYGLKAVWVQDVKWQWPAPVEEWLKSATGTEQEEQP